MYQERAPPVKMGDEVELTIESVGSKGDGIGKVSGFVLFVAGTRKGERVKVRVTKVLANVGFAEVVSRSQPIIQETVGPADGAAEEAAEEPRYEDTENFGEES